MNYLTLTGSSLKREIEHQGYMNPKQVSNLSTGRLAFLPEGGGKTRVIAIGDYLSQQALEPLFKASMSMLRSIPQDATYSQQNGVKLITLAMEAGKPIYCYDLSSATDRFPVKLQGQVLESIYKNGIGQA